MATAGLARPIAYVTSCSISDKAASKNYCYNPTECIWGDGRRLVEDY